MNWEFSAKLPSTDGSKLVRRLGRHVRSRVPNLLQKKHVSRPSSSSKMFSTGIRPRKYGSACPWKVVLTLEGMVAFSCDVEAFVNNLSLMPSKLDRQSLSIFKGK